VLDLLRQAYGATAAWGVGGTEGALRSSPLPISGRTNVTAVQRWCSSHQWTVACTSFETAMPRSLPSAISRMAPDWRSRAGFMPRRSPTASPGPLRRYVGGMRLAEEQSSVPRARLIAGRVSRLVAGAQTLDGMARAAVELGEQITHRGVALVIAGADGAHVVAVSGAADRRLAGTLLLKSRQSHEPSVWAFPVATRGTRMCLGRGSGAAPQRARGDGISVDGRIGRRGRIGPPRLAARPGCAAPRRSRSLLTDLGRGLRRRAPSMTPSGAPSWIH